MPSPNLDHALTAAQRAIDLAVQHALSHQPKHITTKGDRDVVTNIDVAVENLIRDRLCNWDPAVGFVGEESGASGAENTYWVLDPIDGTINFSHGSPLCAIALGLVHDDQPLLGVTAVPFLGHRYWAVTGEGAYRDGDPITVSTTVSLDNALIGMCDYGSGPDASTRDRLCSDLDLRLTGQAQGVRRLGTTAPSRRPMARRPSTPASCSATAPGTPPPERSSRAKQAPSSSTPTAAHTPPVHAAHWRPRPRSPRRSCR